MLGGWTLFCVSVLSKGKTSVKPEVADYRVGRCDRAPLVALESALLGDWSSDRSGRRDSSDELEARFRIQTLISTWRLKDPRREFRVCGWRFWLVTAEPGAAAQGELVGEGRRVGTRFRFLPSIASAIDNRTTSLDRIGPANPSELPRWCKRVGAQREAEPPQRPQRRRTLRPGPPGESTVPEGGQPWPDWVAKAEDSVEPDLSQTWTTEMV